MVERKANPLVSFIQGIRIEFAINSGDSLKASQTAKKLRKSTTEQWMYAIEANAVAEIKGKRNLMIPNVNLIAELGKNLPRK